MRYRSTRSSDEYLSGREAVLQGIAGDGGLFVPDRMDFCGFPWTELMGLSTEEMAERIFEYFLNDFTGIPEIVTRSYTGKFDDPELTPLKKVGDLYVLELFHGPTAAFKDVALSALPVLMSEARKQLGREEQILILTATSGDTGKAAMEGFRDVPGTGIIVFYPYGGVSPVQEAQMNTAEGRNVRAVAVRGNFDDTQTGVKKIFAALTESMRQEKKTVLSSANSINIGRLVPQIVYYFKAYASLLSMGEIALGELVDFTVPTGNFGDILAGYYAKKLGLPVGKLILAANKNNVLRDFIDSGVYDKNRPFYRTNSPSMDILVSSNLERLLYDISGGDCETVKGLMEKLSGEGRYEISEEMLEKLQDSFASCDADEEKTVAAIRKVYEKYGYLIDTHTAVAWASAEEYREKTGSGRKNVVLSTASAYKFPDAVRKALGLPKQEDPFSVLPLIHEETGVKIPENLQDLKKKPVRFTDVIETREMPGYVEKTVDSGDLYR